MNRSLPAFLAAVLVGAWAEYVRTGATGDTTPPAPPSNVKATRNADGSVQITWDAEADFESGLRGFVIQRDGADLVQLPEKPAGRFGRPLWQAMSYHDTPEAPLPAMRFVDRTLDTDRMPVPPKHAYRVIAVNSVSLKSAPSPPASTR